VVSTAGAAAEVAEDHPRIKATTGINLFMANPVDPALEC